VCVCVLVEELAGFLCLCLCLCVKMKSINVIMSVCERECKRESVPVCV